jgi:hypothetical protein
MKTFIKKALAIFAGLGAALGIIALDTSAKTQEMQPAEKIQPTKDTALYLDHATKAFGQDENSILSWHYSHSSHVSHHSHHSHHSHYSG